MWTVRVTFCMGHHGAPKSGPWFLWVDDRRSCRNVFVWEPETANCLMNLNLQLNKVPQNRKVPRRKMWTNISDIPSWASKKQISISLCSTPKSCLHWFTSGFRNLWPHVTVVSLHCPVAAELSSLLWSAPWRCCWNMGCVFEMEFMEFDLRGWLILKYWPRNLNLFLFQIDCDSWLLHNSLCWESVDFVHLVVDRNTKMVMGLERQRLE